MEGQKHENNMRTNLRKIVFFISRFQPFLQEVFINKCGNL